MCLSPVVIRLGPGLAPAPKSKQKGKKVRSTSQATVESVVTALVEAPRFSLVMAIAPSARPQTVLQEQVDSAPWHLGCALDVRPLA